MHTYPIMLDLRGRLAVVVGGGPVGLRKVQSLLEAGAEVKLVEPAPLPQEAQLRKDGVIVIAKPYCAEFLDGALLVFACTDDRALNAQIAKDAQWVGAIANAADQADDCDFFLPAVHRQGEIVIAVGTGGAAPALAAFVRDRLAEALPPKIAEFSAAVAGMREELKSSVADAARRGLIMKQLSSEQGYNAYQAGGERALRELAAIINHQS